MLTFVDWILFIPASFLISMALGPNNFNSIMIGMRHRPFAAVQACTGRVIVFAAMVILTAAGLGIILANSQSAFLVIKWAGVVYLAFLGLKVIFSKNEADLSEGGSKPARKETAKDLARREFMIAAANPKAILIMTAILPQFVDPSGDYVPQFAIIGATFLMTEFAAAWVYSLIGYYIGTRNFGIAIQRRINYATGGMFLIFATILAFSEQEPQAPRS